MNGQVFILLMQTCKSCALSQNQIKVASLVGKGRYPPAFPSAAHLV